MNKKFKWLVLSPIILASSTGLTSCSDDDGYLILRVINSEDYIYLNDPKDPESLPNLTDQFCDPEYNPEIGVFLENHPQYKGVKVVYDTSDTNETLYSELQTGKTNYDLMNVSDYMAQKIVANGMAVPLYEHGFTIPKYEEFASKEIKGRLDNIIAKQKYYDATEGKIVTKDIPLSKYAVGYMWGTLGILFNPNYSGFSLDMSRASEGMSEMDLVIKDMSSFEALWNGDYYRTISIKNSMRDTYAAALLYRYRDEFEAIQQEYIDAGKTEEALATYQSRFTTIFNRCSEGEVAQVKEALDALKKNIFGLEVDSGKQDIVTKKIGVNLAWSGDAVYSMDQAEDPNEVASPFELYYSVPELGSNLWMDTWIMPNNARSQDQYELAHLFLNFLADPSVSAQNMDYTGYTSFTGGDEIIDLVRDWYDARTEDDLMNNYNPYDPETEEEKYNKCEGFDVFCVAEDDSDPENVEYEINPIDYSDFVSNRDSSRNNEKLYYYDPGEDDPVEEPTIDMLTAIMVDENEFTQRQMLYSDIPLYDDPDSGYDAVDLSYFFKGTLTEYDIDNGDAIFYAEDYFYKFVDEEGNPLLDENNQPIENVSVGRQFFCQYPSVDTINRCAVMADYGENNKYVMKMWESFKTDPLPLWAIVTFAIIGVGAISFVTLLIINKQTKKSLRKKRIKK